MAHRHASSADSEIFLLQLGSWSCTPGPAVPPSRSADRANRTPADIDGLSTVSSTRPAGHTIDGFSARYPTCRAHWSPWRQNGPPPSFRWTNSASGDPRSLQDLPTKNGPQRQSTAPIPGHSSASASQAVPRSGWVWDTISWLPLASLSSHVPTKEARAAKKGGEDLAVSVVAICPPSWLTTTCCRQDTTSSVWPICEVHNPKSRPCMFA